MTEREFKVQVLETEAQWNSGLRSGLALDAGGILMFASPKFDSWLAVEDWSADRGDIVTDECGQVYWSALKVVEEGGRERRDWSLYRRNPMTGLTERVLHFKDCEKINPRKMWISRDYLWILDRDEVTERENRVLALSRENFQILYQIRIKGKLIDIDFDDKGVFYALVERRGVRKVRRYPVPPRKKSKPVKLEGLECPVALAIGRKGALYILDAGQGLFIQRNADGCVREIGGLSKDLLKGFKPSAMQIDKRGVIYLASDDPARLHPFDEDGSYLGKVKQDECKKIKSWEGIDLPECIRKIGGIGFDCDGGIHLATDVGLAKFTLTTPQGDQFGVYYSKPLDNGQTERLWHRVELRGHFPEKTRVEVYYYAGDDTFLRSEYEKALASDESVQEKEQQLESLLGPLWKGPNVFTGKAGSGDANPDLLIIENKGRFLWLKLRVATDWEKRPSISEKPPSIRSALIYYERQSYLRYLPPAYREEPASAAFLERFLSLFETVFYNLDRKIDQLHTYFDPGLAPREFLPWLASWINLSIDEELPDERVRRLIARAPHIYARKGTAAALDEFLEIYTGRPVSIIEHARGLKPMVLGLDEFRIGRGTILLGSGPKGFRLGDTSVVGYSAVRDRVADPDEPFLTVARRFTVVVDMEPEEFKKRAATLRRIIDEQKPAHTTFALRLSANQGGIGSAALGINAVVTGTQPYRVGITPLGSGYAIAKGPEALRLERGASVEGPTGL